MSYVKVRIHFSSEYYDEIIGYTDEYGPVAAFICPGKFLDSYPSRSDIIYVTKDSIFPISTIEYNVLPYMRYGSMALFINTIFPNNDYLLVANKSIVRLFERTVHYRTPKSFSHTVYVTKDTLEIDNNVYNFSEQSILDIIPKCCIEEAIKLATCSNIIVHELKDIKQRNNSFGNFFHIYKFSSS